MDSIRDQQWGFIDRVSAPRQPRPGDILITSLEHPELTHGISVSPGAPALGFRGYEAALALAQQLATRARVDVWVLEPQRDAALVGRHRPDTPHEGDMPAVSGQ